MRPPRVLRILGRRIKLVLTTPVTHAPYGDKHFQGMHLGWENAIELDRTLAPDELRATAVHEVVHDLESLVGLELSEAQVCALGTVLFAFIRDNPKFFDWLQERK